MRTLGISAYYHDSAAALIEDGQIVAAAQEERFTRKKHDNSFPTHATSYCIEEAGGASAIDYIVFYEKPFLKFERLLETYLSFAPRGFQSFCKAMPIWMREKLFQKKMIIDSLNEIDSTINWRQKLLFSEHHFSHAASAFFPSPFNEAVILTMDGVGEWATTTVAIGRDNKIEIEKEIHFPSSLGLLYSAVTYFTGFKVNSGEYKVMGLAPYGVAVYKDLILKHLIDVKDDGSFRLNQKYFNYCTGLTMTNKNFEKLFGEPNRKNGEPLTQFHMDLAASIQAVTEEIVIKITKNLAKEYSIPNLCLAGGVALNCVANGKIVEECDFKRVWVQPASGDAGGALGAALSAYYLSQHQPRVVNETDSMAGAYLGPKFDQRDCESRLIRAGAKFTVLDREALFDIVAGELAEGKAVGWHQGRMEFGPRALGARSIIGDPRSPSMQRTLNLKVKFRESFRPFAPAILEEDVGDWFDLNITSPYMLLVATVKEDKRRKNTRAEDKLRGLDRLKIVRSEVPAITHVDYTARVQTVQKRTNESFYNLLQRFKDLTGCPILINTSFNVRGEPIVHTPEDAFRCFMGSDIDLLVIGNCLLKKEDQDTSKNSNYRDNFELD